MLRTICTTVCFLILRLSSVLLSLFFIHICLFVLSFDLFYSYLLKTLKMLSWNAIADAKLLRSLVFREATMCTAYRRHLCIFSNSVSFQICSSWWGKYPAGTDAAHPSTQTGDGKRGFRERQVRVLSFSPRVLWWGHDIYWEWRRPRIGKHNALHHFLQDAAQGTAGTFPWASQFFSVYSSLKYLSSLHSTWHYVTTSIYLSNYLSLDCN